MSAFDTLMDFLQFHLRQAICSLAGFEYKIYMKMSYLLGLVLYKTTCLNNNKKIRIKKVAKNNKIFDDFFDY